MNLSMKNIVLVGFMGTGKTTVARIIAQKLGRDYVDIDALIEKKEAMKIADIFRVKGEPYFRQIEKGIIFEISSSNAKVIACGGGVMLNEENVHNLKKNGILICLEATPGIILKRTKEFSQRPILNVDDPKAKIEELLKIRQPFYSKADYKVDTSELSAEEAADKVIQLAGEK